MRFGMTVDFMMIIEELWRNSGGTTTSAEIHHLSQKKAEDGGWAAVSPQFLNKYH